MLRKCCNYYYYYYYRIITGRATAGIAITQQAILRFFVRRGDTIQGLAGNLAQRRGLQVPFAMPNFALICEYLGFPAPKKTRKIATISNIFALQG